jgi:hypothetical protein
MLLSKPTDLLSTAILTPDVIKAYLYPIRVATVHGIIDHNNFDKPIVGDDDYRNYIESISDMPGSGKLFEGKWMGFEGNYDQYTPVTRELITRYTPYYNGATMIFEDLLLNNVFVAPAEKVCYWGIAQAGANNTFKLYSYSSATGAFTELATTAAYNAVGTKNLTNPAICGDVQINYIMGASVPVSLDNKVLLTHYTFGTSNNFYYKFSDMANYANQKCHYVRSMEFQHSLTKEEQSLMLQNTKSYKEAFGDLINATIGGLKYGKEGRKKLIENAGYYLGKALNEEKDTRTSVNSKFFIDKPYASRLVSLDTRGSCKMKRVDANGLDMPNDQAINYQVYASNESDNELEITVHCMFSGESKLGAEDYVFIVGRIELLFESRL